MPTCSGTGRAISPHARGAAAEPAPLLHEAPGEPAVAALLAAYGDDPAAGAPGSGSPGPDLAIHRDDSMLAHATWANHGSREQALVNYFRTGITASRAVNAVLACWFGARPFDLLDFASGYGRTTRHLVRHLPAERVWVSDVDPAAVELQAHRFGVHGPPSHRDPGQWRPGRSFDAVVCLSLFSHLPRAAFEAWLARLAAVLAPDGLLLFTVHDEAVLLPGREMPGGGFHWEAMSESRTLDPGEYGSAWVAEGFVTAALERCLPQGFTARRFPLALWHLQDLYAVVPRPGADLGRLAVPLEPRGELDAVEWEDGRWRVAGWAVDAAALARGDTGAPQVELLLAGQTVARLTPARPRPDVAALLGDACLDSGWEAELPPGARCGDLLVVRARGADGVVGVLHAGSLEAAALRLELARRERALDDLRHLAELHRLDAIDLRHGIHGMEQSFFWRLRNLWFALKFRLGLVGEDEARPRPSASRRGLPTGAADPPAPGP